MEDYLVERETLAKLVDTLLAQKFPGQPAESFSSLREESIKQLDDRISKAVFGSLSSSQLEELNAMLDRGENDPVAFQDFFKNSGVDIESIIADAMQKFAQEFLGGQNA